jgi:murein DD-endopeptidase MepM/ murein hydrolase activator NlpD
MRDWGALLALTLVAAAPAPDGKSSGPKHLSAKTLAAELSDDDGTSQDKPVSSKASSPKPKAARASDRATAAEEKSSRPKATSTKPPAAAPTAAKAMPISDTKAAGGQKPVWEVTTVAADAVQIAKSTYIVQPGDTLSAVVRRTGEGADVIAHDNDLQAPFKLRPGQKLKIAGGRYHTVKKGQSGIAIARSYQVEWSKIIELNHLQDPFTLREGQRLLLPPAQDVAKMSLEQRAAAFKIDLTDLATGSEPALAPTARAAPPSASPTRQLAPTTPVAEPEVAFVGRFDWPVQGKIIRPYGPMDNGGRNDGIAIAAPRGSAIAAAADGVVMWVGEHPAFGNVVLIKHGSGWITIYGNADKLLVKRGQAVKIGQTIARVGTSGTSAGTPQTFFEVLQGRKPVNPMGLLPKRTRQPDSDDGSADPDQNNN